MDTQQGAALVRGRGWRIPPRILDASIVVVFGVVAVVSAIFGPLQKGATDAGRPGYCAADPESCIYPFRP